MSKIYKIVVCIFFNLVNSVASAEISQAKFEYSFDTLDQKDRACEIAKWRAKYVGVANIVGELFSLINGDSCSYLRGNESSSWCTSDLVKDFDLELINENWLKIYQQILEKNIKKINFENIKIEEREYFQNNSEKPIRAFVCIASIEIDVSQN